MKGKNTAAALAAVFAMLFTSGAAAAGGEQQTIQYQNTMPAAAVGVSDVNALPSSAFCVAGIRNTILISGVHYYFENGVNARSLRAREALREDNGDTRITSFTVRNEPDELADTEDIPEKDPEDTQLEELRAYALETCDAQGLRYLHEMEEEKTSVRSGSARISSFYGSDDLIHNSRFDGVYKDFGIDVSYFQPNINWNKVKNDGVTFAVIRLGYRSYVKSGPLVVDKDFYKNYRGAKDAGLQVGVYFYTQATTPEEAREEADFVVSTLDGAGLDLPVFYDIETADFAPTPGRLDSAGLTVEEKTQLCRSFCDRINEKGYWSSIYANNYWLTNMIKGVSLSYDYPIWVATYGKSTAFTGQYDMWQYSSKGKIDGISGNVDLNVRYYVDHAPAGVPTVSFSNGKLSWSAVSGADGYEVYTVDTSDNAAHAADVIGTYYDVTDPKIKAYFVKPYDLYGGRRYTGKASEQVDAVGRVGDISCERIGIDKVRFTWEAVEGASGYEVYTDIGGETLLCDTNKTSAELSGKDLQDHKVKIRAYNSARVYGKFSSSQHIKGNMPDGIIDLRCDEGVLLWDLNEDCDGYTVFMESNVKGSQQFDTKALFFCADRDINAVYTVKAYRTLEGKRFYNECSDSAEVSAVSSPPQGRPDLTITGGADPTLSWSRVDNADGYAVFKADNAGFEFEIGKTDMLEYTLSDTVEGKFFVKPYRIAGDKVLYGSASDTIGFFDAKVIDVSEIIFDNNHCIISWKCSQWCQEYKVFADGELLSSISGDMAVIDMENIANVNECVVIPVKYDNGIPLYGMPERIPR